MKNDRNGMGGICITGLGLVTSVGHDHKTACASIRAGLRRPKWLINYNAGMDKDIGTMGEPVSGHPVMDGDYDDSPRRMSVFLAMALNDLRRDADIATDLLDNTFVFLALPEDRRIWIDDPDVQDMVRIHLARNLPDSSIRIYRNGHAGMLFALSDAVGVLQSGVCPRVIVAGTDSLIGHDDLVRFEAQGRLRTVSNSDGLIPGEAASAVLVETLASVVERNATVRCVIDRVVTELEDLPVISGKPATGKGLSRAVDRLIGGYFGGPLSVDAVISDLNGECYRFSEWAMIQTRCMDRINGEKSLSCPAQYIGDTGAASPGVALCVAARTMARGGLCSDPDKNNSRAMILSASDTGERGAILVESFNGGSRKTPPGVPHERDCSLEGNGTIILELEGKEA